MSKHRYAALDDPSSQIRLLRLGTSNDPACLNAWSSHHSLEPGLAFIALSYEWGEQEPLLDLQLDGKVMHIRHNLWIFLELVIAKLKARETSADSLFWVDAVCIDQANVAEKNAQVALMGSIFSSTAMTYAWLGMATSLKPEVVFDFLLSESRRQNLRNGDMHPPDSIYYPERVQDVLILSRCSYWTRRWILQELLLSDKVIVFWGSAELSLDHLLTFIHRFHPHALLTARQSIVESVLARVACFSQTAKLKDLPLLDLLKTFSDLECDMNLDRVYALRSLARERESIVVDYNITIEVLICRLLMLGGRTSYHNACVLECVLGMEGSGLVSQPMLSLNRNAQHLVRALPPPALTIEPLRSLSRIQRIIPLDIDSIDLDTYLHRLDWLRKCDTSGIPLKTKSSAASAEEIARSELLQPLLEMEAQCRSIPKFADASFELQQFKTNPGRSPKEHHIPFSLRAASELKNIPGNQWIRYRNERGGWIMICDNGIIGVVCDAARIGDHVCRAKSGHLLVVREGFTSEHELIGNAWICDETTRDKLSDMISKEFLTFDTQPKAVQAVVTTVDPMGSSIFAKMDMWELMFLVHVIDESKRHVFLRGQIQTLYYPRPACTESRRAKKGTAYRSLWAVNLAIPVNGLDDLTYSSHTVCGRQLVRDRRGNKLVRVFAEYEGRSDHDHQKSCPRLDCELSKRKRRRSSEPVDNGVDEDIQDMEDKHTQWKVSRHIADDSDDDSLSSP